MIEFTYKRGRSTGTWRDKVCLAVYYVLQVVDASVFLGSLTILSSDFAARFLFSDAVTNFTEPT